MAAVLYWLSLLIMWASGGVSLLSVVVLISKGGQVGWEERNKVAKGALAVFGNGIFWYVVFLITHLFYDSPLLRLSETSGIPHFSMVVSGFFVAFGIVAYLMWPRIWGNGEASEKAVAKGKLARRMFAIVPLILVVIFMGLLRQPSARKEILQMPGVSQPAAVEKRVEEKMFNYSGFEVAVQEGGISLSIVGYTGESQAVVIPAIIRNLPVTRIETNAFRDMALTSTYIPYGVTVISPFAFHDNQLTSVTIPDSVTNISAFAFTNNQLLSVSIPSHTIIITDIWSPFDQDVEITRRN